MNVRISQLLFWLSEFLHVIHKIHLCILFLCTVRHYEEASLINKQSTAHSLFPLFKRLHLVVPLQYSSGEEPADADGPRG